MQSTTQRGFNLLELMMTVFILALVLGLGVPNLRSFMDETRMTGAANDLLTGLHLARSEAVKRQRIVTICTSADPDAPACIAGSLDGWFVFEDTDGDGDFDAGEADIRAEAGPSGNITLAADGSYLSYAPSGFRTNTAATPSASLVLLCDQRGTALVGGDRTAARLIRIDPTGRPQTLRSPTEVAAAIATLGATCP